MSIKSVTKPVSKFNTDGWRFFIGTMIQTWFPIVYALGWVEIEKETFGAIQAALILSVNGFFQTIKANPT